MKMAFTRGVGDGGQGDVSPPTEMLGGRTVYYPP